MAPVLAAEVAKAAATAGSSAKAFNPLVQRYVGHDATYALLLRPAMHVTKPQERPFDAITTAPAPF